MPHENEGVVLTDTIIAGAADLLQSIEDVLEDHDLLVGTSLSSLQRLREDLRKAINGTAEHQVQSRVEIGEPLSGIVRASQTAPAWSLSEDGLKSLEDLKGEQAKAAANGTVIAGHDPCNTQLRRGATFTYDGDGTDAYYFAPVARTKPPYLRQMHVDATVDVASDGSLAGVELILANVPPPPTMADGPAVQPRQSDIDDAIQAVRKLIAHKVFVLGTSRDQSQRDNQTIYVTNLTSMIDGWKRHERLLLWLGQHAVPEVPTAAAVDENERP
jgi:hypothetical protein